VTDKNVNSEGGLGATSSSLLKRVRAQERAAWERLVHLYGPLVYQWCRADGLQSEDAEDVGQEVFAVVFRKVADFRRERQGDTFRGWLRVIARNKMSDFQRARHAGGPPGVGGTDCQRQMLQVPADETDASAPVALPSETGLLARRAMELLQVEFSVESWQAFYRVVVDRVPPAEVAAELGMSANMVYLAKSRGLRRLREEFGELIEYG
jgi:RNA polymerase sigma-70 factor, ECF subfamily